MAMVFLLVMLKNNFQLLRQRKLCVCLQELATLFKTRIKDLKSTTRIIILSVKMAKTTHQI